MLYILAGASNSGKSILARRLTKEHNIPYFSLDLLTSIFSEKNIVPVTHATTVEERAGALWKFTRPLASHITGEIDTYLLEGDAILPHQVTQLQQENPGKILSCFLGYTQINPQKKLELVRSHEHLPDSWTQNFTDTQVLQFINARIKFSIFLKKECTKYNSSYIEVSDHLDNVYESLTQLFNLSD